VEAHANLGEAYPQYKQVEAAIRQLQWAIRLHREEPQLYRTLARAHLKRRRMIAAGRRLGEGNLPPGEEIAEQ